MNRNDAPRTGQLVRKLAIVTVVVATGFLCGWSALGVTGGVVLAVALGSGVAVPVFRSEATPVCRFGRYSTVSGHDHERASRARSH
jgi:hypothetical protein